MLLALVDVSGEKQDRVHEPARTRFRLPMTFPSYLRLCVDWTRTKARGPSVKAEKHRVTCNPHGVDIATDRRNPIIDCS